MSFVSNWASYIVNNSPAEKEFIVCKGEKMSLNMIDILDATDITLVELLDVTCSPFMDGIKKDINL